MSFLSRLRAAIFGRQRCEWQLELLPQRQGSLLLRFPVQRCTFRKGHAGDCSFLPLPLQLEADPPERVRTRAHVGMP